MSVPFKERKQCKDCLEESGYSMRPAPHPGPRCFTHHHKRKKALKALSHERRVVDVYGLLPGEYERLLAFQGGVCAICARPPVTKRLAVDHDHACCPGNTSCGECVRGLICGPDNSYLAHIRDSVNRAMNLLAYLQDPPAKRMRRHESR